MADTGFNARWITALIEPKLCQSPRWRCTSPATPNDSLFSFLSSIAPLVALRVWRCAAELGAHVYEGCRPRVVSADIHDADLYHGELSVTAEACLQPFQDTHFKSYHPGFNEGGLPQRERGEYSLFSKDGGWGTGCVPSLINEEVAQGGRGGSLRRYEAGDWWRSQIIVTTT